MPAFKYEALSADGRSQQGVIQADTARAARGLLRERGLAPIAVTELVGADGERGRLTSTGRVVFTRQLATLVKAGLPLEEALAALAEGAEGRTQAITLSLRARVMEGATLAAALAEFPGAFDALFRATVAAGEQSGRLDVVLARLADHLESRDAQRRQFIAALTYPTLLTVVAVLVVAGLVAYVVPQVAEVFTRSGQHLPLPTRALLALTDMLTTIGPWLPLLLVPVALLGVVARGNPGHRRRWHRGLLAMPVLGVLIVKADAARFARTLALLGGSAVPLLDALRLARSTVANQVLAEQIDQATARVREGMPLSRALARTERFPAVALRLIASGERAGRLDAMLDEAADQLERELRTVIEVVGSTLGPAVILVVGGLVLFIVLAILLPIFQMNQLIR